MDPQQPMQPPAPAPVPPAPTPAPIPPAPQPPMGGQPPIQPQQQMPPQQGASVGYILKIIGAVLGGFFLIGFVFGLGSAIIGSLLGPNYVATEAEEGLAPLVVMHPMEWELTEEDDRELTFVTGEELIEGCEDGRVSYVVGKSSTADVPGNPQEYREDLEADLEGAEGISDFQFEEEGEFANVSYTGKDIPCDFDDEETYDWIAVLAVAWNEDGDAYFFAAVTPQVDGAPSLDELRDTAKSVRSETIKANPEIF